LPGPLFITTSRRRRRFFFFSVCERLFEKIPWRGRFPPPSPPPSKAPRKFQRDPSTRFLSSRFYLLRMVSREIVFFFPFPLEAVSFRFFVRRGRPLSPSEVPSFRANSCEAFLKPRLFFFQVRRRRSVPFFVFFPQNSRVIPSSRRRTLFFFFPPPPPPPGRRVAPLPFSPD